MQELRGFRFEGAVIIEHRKDGTNVVGRVEYAGTNGDGSVGIGWHSHESGNRTTCFQPKIWMVEVKEGVVFFKRLAEDKRDFDIPWRECDNYTVVPRGS